MYLQFSGTYLPGELLELVAALTDGARLRHGEVIHDQEAGIVRLPMMRLPLVKKRKVLPNLRKVDQPIPAVVTLRKVISCQIQDHTSPEMGETVQLIFGLQLQGRRINACSAEEDRGQSCFSLTAEVSELNLEIKDRPEGDQDEDSKARTRFRSNSEIRESADGRAG